MLHTLRIRNYENRESSISDIQVETNNFIKRIFALIFMIQAFQEASFLQIIIISIVLRAEIKL